MQAIIIREFGPAKNMEYVTLPTPEVSADELLIKVVATSVNPVDIQTRRGDYSADINLPACLGVDISGVVEKVGSDVTNFKIGDEVYYVPRLLANEGSYATHHVEKSSIVALKPKNLSHQDAAALPLAAGTAWECLVERGRLVKGNKVLIHGGSGGVGVYALQIAKLFGAHVVTTCSPGNFEFVRFLGAQSCYNYKDCDLYCKIAEDHLDGFDIILDTVGGNTIQNSLGLLSNKGRVVSIVDQSIPQNLLGGWAVNGEVHFVFNTQSAERLKEIANAVEKKLIVPVVEKVMHIDEIIKAHTIMESGGRKGKIVILT
ncbi:NADP-dependent oxidoreductase [Enterobacter sp. Ap-916]|uniref:NADP-dependent oxidoreductase n=1 Tax=unclassified Enterobacter TaxID=2608935 RepID=UPI00141E32DF|nr:MULTISPECIES: NADP-dependent oxidoreductase [unclassified Enterobacter]NIF59289.1 NADP-dependent oxidoreductase [Enterobacter sp. Ap-867]NIG30985.1 NADP-dependent oxidoreductase [Enterobacter sp. Ap-916]